jgi:hypothetical protein
VDTPHLPPRQRRGVDAVLFDFHGTIAQVEDAVEWVLAAAAECGVTLDLVRATALADQLVTVGRAGGPRPSKVPPHLAEVYADRDLDTSAHRAACQGSRRPSTRASRASPTSTTGCCALRLAAYADTLPTLRACTAGIGRGREQHRLRHPGSVPGAEFAGYVAAGPCPTRWAAASGSGHLRYACRALGWSRRTL